jgi:FdrA protein
VVVKSRVRKGAYYDSVTLMNVARELAAREGVDDAAAVMATRENKAILAASGMESPALAEAGDADLVLTVRAGRGGVADAALAAADALLDAARGRKGGGTFAPRSVEGALAVMPDANLALISVAGKYAGEIASRALDGGLHVMLFSDNVPLDEEIALKKRARGEGLLVMGPDCGSAIIAGVPLGFANVVARGPVGIVAASGTGLQEVSTLVSRWGSGVSHAIGTGSRDVTKEVGGITFLAGIEALAADPSTTVLVLVSKPPHPDVLSALRAAAVAAGKPTVSVFLGGKPAGPLDARTLDEAAALATALAAGADPEVARRTLLEGDAGVGRAVEEVVAARGGRSRVRALMSGGTFAAEAGVVFADEGLKEVFSNVAVAGVEPLPDPLTSRATTIVDMGADAFTVGRPHPMIDYSLRLKRILEEARDPEVAVVLLDVVLGYGAHTDPASELVPVLRQASRTVSIVCSVTGTAADPQNADEVAEALRGAGALVMKSNAEACRVAARAARSLGGA